MTDSTPTRRDFEASYREGTPPWEIGRPQPEIVALAEAGEIVGDVLDLGCGTGENALYLAARGHRVAGLDASPTAIARAREKAAARGLPAAFFEGDVMKVRQLVPRRFETAVDSGLFHVFEQAERRAYAHALEGVLAPGSTLHLLCFSDEEPPGPGPKRLSEYEIRDAFRSIFTPTRIREGRFESHLHPGGAKAWVATLVKI